MSRTALKHFIASSGALATGMEEFSDGEQKLDVITASEPSIDHDVAEMVESKIEQDEISRDTDTLVEAQESLEAYMTLLEQGLDDGGISGQSAAFLRQGLERYEDLLGFDALTPSVEAFGGSASQKHSTTISLEALSDTLKKGWEALKRAMAALWNAVKDVATKATGAAAKLEKRALELRSKSNALGGMKPQNTEITIKNPKKLFADGKWAGDDVAAVRGFLELMTKKYPESVLRYIGDVSSAISGFDPTADNADAQVSALLDIDGIFSQFPGSALPANDTRFPGGVEAKRSAIMPGNQAMYIARPDPATKTDIEALKKLNGKLSVSMMEVTTAKKAPESYDVKVDKPLNLVKTASMIASAAATIGKMEKDSDKIKKAIDELTKAGDTLREKADKAELTSEQSKTVDAVLRGLTASHKLLGTSVNGALTYGVSTLNAQLSVVERQMAEYKASASAESE